MAQETGSQAQIAARLHELMEQLAHAASTSTGRQFGNHFVSGSVALLQKMISPQAPSKVQTLQVQRTLIQNSSDSASFKAKYEKLKAAGVPGLDRFLVMVVRIMQDPDLVKLVADPNPPSNSALPSPSSGLTALGPASGSGTPVDALSRWRPQPLQTTPGWPDSLSNTPISRGDSPVGPLRGGVAGAGSPGLSSTGAPGGSAVTKHMPPLPESVESKAKDGRLQAAARNSKDAAVLGNEMKALHVDGGSQRAPGERSVGQAAGQAASGVEDPKALVEGVHYPSSLSWNTERPFLTGQHLWQDAEVLGGDQAQLQSHGRHGTGHQDLGSLPPLVQELLVLDDLLYAMMGIEGRYVHARRCAGGSQGVNFYIDGTMDVSLQELAKRILPLCDNHYVISQFAEERWCYKHGLVSHALAAAIRGLLQDYQILVAQLDHQLRIGTLSLQGLWFYCQPMLRAMEVLAGVVVKAEHGNFFGAAVLNHLEHEAALLAGDSAIHALLHQLLHAASAPYFDMLEKWVYEGVVDDPYGEFLIEEHSELQKESLTEDFAGTYWNLRYVLRPEVPTFLVGHTETILTTGKYLNAIRECGHALRIPHRAGMPFAALADGGGRSYLEHIKAAHDFASEELLRIVMGECDLLGRLRSMKHYFLLDQGDYLVHLLDTAKEELNKKPNSISLEKLQSLLELAVRTSVCVNDPYYEDVTCAMERQSMLGQLYSVVRNPPKDAPDQRPTLDFSALAAAGESGRGQGPSAAASTVTGLETFTLDYKVRWPLTIILSRKSLTKYQFIFRHLFHCKYVERQLFTTWQAHQATRGLDLSGSSFMRSYFLCQRMVHFLQNFMHYMTFEAIEPNWHVMEAKLQAAKTIDEVVSCHEEFLDKCLKECLLLGPKILRKVHNLRSICLQYSMATQWLVPVVQLDREQGPGQPMAPQRARDAGGPPEGTGAVELQRDRNRRKRRQQLFLLQARRSVDDSTFNVTVGRLEPSFNAELRDFIIILTSCSQMEPHLTHLLQRLQGVGQGLPTRLQPAQGALSPR